MAITAATAAVIVAFSLVRFGPPASAGGAAPTADVGGPYVIAEGDELALDASGSSDPETDPLTYAWDLDNDGQYDDATGIAPVIAWEYLAARGVDDDGSRTIGLEVGDGTSTATDSSALTVTNTAPTVALRGHSAAVAGASYELTVEVDEPGDDTISEWVIGWGDGRFSTGTGDPGAVTHTYSATGLSRSITVQLTDEDGTWTDADAVIAMFDTTDTVSRFDSVLGANIADFATSGGALDTPYGVALGPDGLMYVSGLSTNSVVRFDPVDNSFVDTFVSAALGGLSQPKGLSFGPDGNLYVVSAGTPGVKRYDGATGAYLGDFSSGAALNSPQALLFAPDGTMLVTDGSDDNVEQYSGTTGASMGVFATASPGDQPVGITSGPNGNIYVAMFGNGVVREFDDATGNLVGTFASTGLSTPHSIVFGPDGDLWITDYFDEQVRRFDGTTGAALGTRIAPGSPSGPFGIIFTPSSQVQVTEALEVNSTGNATDNNLGDGVCTTGGFNADTDPECTLRAAIDEANSAPAASVITFDIPVGDSGHTAGVWAIEPTSSQLPWITTPITIDATSQPSYGGSPVIMLDGSSLIGSEHGLALLSPGHGSTVAGLSIVGFPGDSITSNVDRFVLEDSYLGVEPDGLTATGGGGENVAIFGGTDIRIQRNLIGGSTDANVAFTSAATEVAVTGNTIGTDLGGTLDFGGAQGIWTDAGGSLTIGGVDPGDGNVIANSTFQGIQLNGSGGATAIIGNDIRDNGFLGIDLADISDPANGVTANDANDADSGANELQNFPVLGALTEAGGTVTAGLDLDAVAGTYRIDLYANPGGVDPSGYGEGEQHLGFDLIAHAGGGSATFSIAVPGTSGDVVTATATRISGGTSSGITSEFSTASTVTSGAGPDSDGDGLWDSEEDANTDADNDPSTNPGPNTDGDAFPNYLDSDDDGDGAPTASENADPNADGDPRDAVDSDRDGQPDYLDPPITGVTDGTVKSEQKTSDLVGGLSAALVDNEMFGRAVSSIGDVDGDGVGDVVVGAPGNDDGGNERGAVYVLFMNADGTVKAEQKISDTTGGLSASLTDFLQFGGAVAGAGDVDGDGVIDLLVGTTADSGGGTNRGAVYVLFLNADGTVKAEQKISDLAGGFSGPLADSDRFGGSVASLGDVDGDGIVDVAVGTNGSDDGGTDRGALYVLFLNADGTVKSEQKISDIAGGLSASLADLSYFGTSVAGLGDFDGDGVADVAVSAIGDSDGGANRGAVYVLMLNADGTVKAEQKISDTAGGLSATLANSDYFGTDLTGVGDADGDGIGDLVVGATGDDDGGTDRGAVYVLLLNADGSVKAEQKISDTAGGLVAPMNDFDRFGSAASSLGDHDGDGVLDLVVGTNADEDGGNNRGAVYVLSLSTVGGPPVATDDTVTALQDRTTLIDVLVNDSDPDGDTVDVVDISSPTNGTATITPGGLVSYTPNGSYTGPDSFEYLVNDSTTNITNYWSLDGDGFDGEGGNDGVITGTTAVPGQFGDALSFNETSDRVTIPDVTYGADFTLSFEFKLDDNTGSLFQYVYSHGDINGTNSINVFLLEASHGTDPNVLRTVVRDADDTLDNAALQVDISSIVGDGQWHTYAVTADSTNGLTVWLDGAVVASDATRGTDPVDPTGSLYLGTRQDLVADRWYGGALDTVQLINGSLSSSDVAGREAEPNRGLVSITVVPCTESDSDGLCDLDEDANIDADDDPATNPGPDTDGDTLPNYLDADDDGDGTPTASESADPNGDGDPRDAKDIDRDGQPDYLDAPTLPTAGTVDDEQKISDLAGGLTAILDDSDEFGTSVSSVGDVDGDGVLDIAVGAYTDDDGGTDRGAVYLLFLNANGTVRAEQKISDTQGGLATTLDDNDFFGISVAGVGDIDGDGIGDLAVGAYGDDDDGTNRGAFFILFLNPDGTVKAEQKISDTQGGLATTLGDSDNFGYAVSGLGDIDGDGVLDLAVGAYGDDDGGTGRGAVYVLLLNPDGTVKDEQKLSETQGGLTITLDDTDWFGSALSGVGDLDGDGVPDLVVGAYADDDGGNGRGAVYVLLLNADGTVRAEQKISDTQGGLTTTLDDSDFFGRSVSGVGDLDRDGVLDIAVGAIRDDDGGPNRGAVHVLFLNADGTVKDERTISDSQGGLTTILNNDDFFGRSVAGLGDLDGDGFIDIALGADGDDDGGSDRGTVYILNLTSLIDSDGDGLWDYEEDANTDADADPATNPGPNTDGDANPNYLDADDDGDTIPTASENADPDADGDPRDALDSDHDGQPDYLDAPTTATGRTVGAEQKISDTAGGLSEPLADGDEFGDSVAGIGDLDGDGVNDAAVGISRDDDGGADRGAAMVLFLNGDGTVRAEQKISAIAGGLTATLDDGDRFGFAVSGIGDLDGDGLGDIAVGTRDDDDGGIDRGAVHILFMNADGTVRAEQKISDTAGGLTASLDDADQFGHGVAGLADIDGDGVRDLAVGAIGDDDGVADAGAVYILLLNTDGTVKAERKISAISGGLVAGFDPLDSFGFDVADAGDIDSDGVTDIVVGAYGDDDGGPDRGAAYVLRLNADGTVKAEQKISDTVGGLTATLDDADHFGRATTAIGDVNGDGLGDLLVSAPFDDDGGAERGAVYILTLATDGTVTSTAKISSTEANFTGPLDDADYFGTSVAGLGDINGNGTIDIAVGVQFDDDGGADRGAVYVLDPAKAATVTVNSTGDAVDSTPGDGICATGGDNSTGAWECTLRAAIEEANASSDIDTVHFGIPTADAGHTGGVWTIQPGSQFDNLTETVTLDARTQPGWTGNPVVEIDGSTTSAQLGLHILTGTGSTIAGFSIGDYERPLAVQDAGATIAGNWIGVRADGVSTWAQAPEEGIRFVNGAGNAMIGGTAAADRNVIVDATVAGVYFWSSDAVTLQNNTIGRLPDDTTAAPNAVGILVQGSTDDLVIGGTTAAEANIIADNTGAGIVLNSGVDNAILGNTIMNNGDLGIDITGGNELLNAPVVTGAAETLGTVLVETDLDVPAGSYRLEAFTNPGGADSSGFGEGESFESAATIIHTGSGTESFQLIYTGAAGDLLALTATEDLGGGSYGSTSEFSNTLAATHVSSVTVNSTGDGGDNNLGDGICTTGGMTATLQPECTLRAAIEDANATGATMANITFSIPDADTGHSGGGWTIAPTGSPLPEIAVPVAIDASSQPEYTSMPVIDLDGSAFSATSEHAIDLGVGSDGSTVRGLAIVNWPGIGLYLEGSDDHVIAGNHLGINGGGATSAGNRYGIYLSGSSNTTIGGSTPKDRNVISGNTSTGLAVYNSIGLGLDSLDTTITGNYIGTDATGLQDRGNASNGILVVNGSSRTQIGGSTPDLANVVSANSGDGITVGSGSMADSVVEGNLVGVTVDQTAALPNDGIGLELSWSQRTIARNNVIGSTGGDAIVLLGADNAVVTGNRIGTNATDAANWTIGGHGILVSSSSDFAMIGGTGGGDGNLVRNAAGDGIHVDATAGAGTSVLGNRITKNFGLAVDLSGGTEDSFGVTTNDATDADTGVNDLLNFPVITSVGEAAGTVTVDFDLDVPAGTYRIETFRNTAPDPSLHGEAAELVAAVTIIHTGSGVEPFSVGYTGAATDVVTLNTTADEGGGDFGATSEFSKAVVAQGPATALVNSTADGADSVPGDGFCATGAANTAGDAECTLRAALDEAAARAETDAIGFAIPTTEAGHLLGVWTIAPAGALPAAVDVSLVDGTSQPGWATTPVIVLDGSGAGAVDGLVLATNDAVLRGMSLGNFARGVVASADRVSVDRNHIGVSAAGTAATGNASGGLWVGGVDAVISANIVSGNGDNGITVSNGADRARIVDNLIGVDASGITALPNAQEGIELGGAADVVIGEPGAGNTIAGNGYSGVNGFSTSSTRLTLQSNTIGVGSDGTTPVPNGTTLAEGGISSRGPNTGWLIGGTGPGEGNTIAHNIGDGVQFFSGNGLADDIAIIGNSIFANTDLGIDFGDDGVTPNDQGDTDPGHNQQLNFPEIVNVQRVAGDLVVDLELDVPAGDHRIELFGNSAADASGYGEGATPLGGSTVTHTGSGVEPFQLTVPSAATILSSTTTEDLGAGSYGSTSEFSRAVRSPDLVIVNSTGDSADVTPGDGQCDTGGLNIDTDPECTLRAAIEEANDSTTPVDTIWFDIPVADPGESLGAWTIAPATPLPVVTDAAEIDGSTQPGFMANTAAAPLPLNGSPVIEIDGQGVTSGDGLHITAATTTIRGLIIGGFPGADDFGIEIQADDVTVTGSYVGSHADGTTGNASSYGIWINGARATIGGIAAGHRNIVSGNTNAQVVLSSGRDAVILGNLIGPTAAVDALVSPFGGGIAAWSGADVTIGSPAAPNVIGAGTSEAAIEASGSGTLIEANLIGTDATATVDLGGYSGIDLQAADIDVVDNVIGNNEIGVTIGGTGATLTGNAIGTDAAGLLDIGNTQQGIEIRSGATGSVIGGTTTADANLVAHNGAAGIATDAPDAGIIANRIWANDGLGIDHAGDGRTANDSPDADGITNAPLITAAVAETSGTVVDLSLTTAAGAYRIDFFENPSGADSSGYGEGELPVDSVAITHGGGTETFRRTVPSAVGSVISATATASTPSLNSTSEFSNSATVIDAAATRVADSSARRSDVAEFGGAAAGQTGRVGEAIDVSGGVSQLRGPGLDLHDSSLTMSASVQPDTVASDHSILSKIDGSGNVIYEIAIDGATAEATATLRLSGAPVIASGGVVSTGNWTSVDAIWDGAELALLVNGVEVDRVAATGTLATDPTTRVTVGNRSDTSAPFDGRIDQVTVTHGSESADAILARSALASAPAAFITVGAEQSGTPQPWTVGATQSRSGGFALEAPDSSGPGAAAWAVATGIDEPGLVFTSWWWLSTDTGIDLGAGTRTGPAPTDQYEAALVGPSGWELRRRSAGNQTTDAAAAGVVTTGAWVEVEIWTDQLGDSRVLIDGAEVTGWTAQGTDLATGSLGLRSGLLPVSEDWYVDDARARRLVTPEPITSLGPLDRN